MIRTSSRVRTFIVLPALALILAAFSAWCSGCMMLAAPYKGHHYGQRDSSASRSTPMQAFADAGGSQTAFALSP